MSVVVISIELTPVSSLFATSVAICFTWDFYYETINYNAHIFITISYLAKHTFIKLKGKKQHYIALLIALLNWELFSAKCLAL